MRPRSISSNLMFTAGGPRSASSTSLCTLLSLNCPLCAADGSREAQVKRFRFELEKVVVEVGHVLADIRIAAQVGGWVGAGG